MGVEAGAGWTVTESLPTSSRPCSQEANAGPLVALACSQRMLKLKLRGQTQQVTIFLRQSLQFSQWHRQLKLPLPRNHRVSPRGCETSHTQKYPGPSPGAPRDALVCMGNLEHQWKGARLLMCPFPLSFWSPSQDVTMTHASPARTPGGLGSTYLLFKHLHASNVDLVI